MRRKSKSTARTASVALAALALTACNSLPFTSDKSGDKKATVVEVEVTSDAASAARVRVEINARKNPKRVDDTDAALPYSHTFEVPNDTPLPLTSTSIEATADGDASWISCRITINGKVVADERANGAGATAFCEKKLRIGAQ